MWVPNIFRVMESIKVGRPGRETVWLALTTDRTWQVLAWLSMIACCLPGLAFLCVLSLTPELPHFLHILCHTTLALQPSPEHPSRTVFPCPASVPAPTLTSIWLPPFPLPFQPHCSLLSLTYLPGMSWPGAGGSFFPKPLCFCCLLASDPGRNPTC